MKLLFQKITPLVILTLFLLPLKAQAQPCEPIRERCIDFYLLAAVAIVIGGVAGYAIGQSTNHHHHHRRTHKKSPPLKSETFDLDRALKINFSPEMPLSHTQTFSTFLITPDSSLIDGPTVSDDKSSVCIELDSPILQGTYTVGVKSLNPSESIPISPMTISAELEKSSASQTFFVPVLSHGESFQTTFNIYKSND